MKSTAENVGRKGLIVKLCKTNIKFEEYEVLGQINELSTEADLFLIKDNDEEKVLKLYRPGIETNDIKLIIHNNLLKIEKTGVFCERKYEITKKLEKSNLKVEDLPKFIKEISVAIDILHKNNIAHRDLKPSNILKDGDTFVISDYGSSSTQAATCLTMARGTLAYSAPEALTGMYSYASDWYSFGAIIYEVLYNKQLVTDFYRGVAGEVSIPSGEYQYLLQGLLNKDYNKRWGKSEIDAFLNGTKNAKSEIKIVKNTMYDRILKALNYNFDVVLNNSSDKYLCLSIGMGGFAIGTLLLFSRFGGAWLISTILTMLSYIFYSASAKESNRLRKELRKVELAKQFAFWASKIKSNSKVNVSKIYKSSLPARHDLREKQYESEECFLYKITTYQNLLYDSVFGIEKTGLEYIYLTEEETIEIQKELPLMFSTKFEI